MLNKLEVYGMLHPLKSPPFKGFDKELFHLQKPQMCIDWVAAEAFNYLERLFVRQRLQKRSPFQVSVFMRWKKVLSVRNKLTAWWGCTLSPVILFLSWLLPSRLTHTTGEPAGWFCDITQQDGFHFMHNQCWFYTWLGFIALTRTRDAPSPHVILNAAEVQWNDITTPGRQSEASGPAGLPPSCRDWSIQPKSLGVKIQEWKHQINTSLCATCDCWGANVWRNTAEQQQSEERQTGEVHL